MVKKWNVLFMKEGNSEFNVDTALLSRLFETTDEVSEKEEALRLLENKTYDIVIADLTVNPERLGFLKQLQDLKTEQCIFALVAEKDTDKLYGIADMGIHAFELNASQLEQALEVIANFDPYSEH